MFHRVRESGRPVIVSISGGKDSVATALFLRENKIPYTLVHFDTGWEHADTVKHVREVLPEHLGPIHIIGADPVLKPEEEAVAQRIEAMLGWRSSMVRVCLKKGMFPSRVKRFCTQELKVFIANRYMEGKNAISAVGIRAAESDARALMGEWEEHPPGGGDYSTWRPIIAWTEQDVIDIHHQYGVPPNPLYLKGASRVGCWPCIFARKHEIRMMAEVDPQRVQIIELLETEITRLQRERAAAKGTTPEERGHVAPAFFTNPTTRKNGAGGHSGAPMPISEVVAWSKTKRGGREDEPFAPLPHEDGCMRWGFCDTSWTNRVIDTSLSRPENSYVNPDHD